MIIDVTRKTTREDHNPYRTIRVYRATGKVRDHKVYVPQYVKQDSLTLWK